MITIVALVTMLGGFVFDWNETHIFNPRWPPHAKFHNAQTMVLGALLGFLSVWFLWFQQGEKRVTLQLAVLFGSLYWLGQVGAYFFPGTALFDPEFTHPGQWPDQLILDGILFFLLSVGYWLERRRLSRPATIR
ncbi:acetyltransferase [Spirosoma pollinicola]|uniref:Acetyltransferase n=1 Tax=Spirosoma pollinicola TaxID=2057025 RepID=A0A2K8ZBV1_9BACT|nr:acetyltransferase [Spirosoma pollinicola]